MSTVQRNVTAAGDAAAVSRGGLANLAGALVSAVANFAIIVLVARRLSPGAAGAFFSVTSLFVVLEGFGRLGSDVGAVYFIARWRARGQAGRIRAGLRAAVVPVVVLGVVAALVLLLLASRISRWMGDGSATTADQLRVLAAVLPVAVGYDVLVGATRGFGRMRATVMLEKVARPLLQVALVAAVLAAGSGGWAATAWGLPYLVVGAASVVAMRRLLRGVPRVGIADPPRAVAREFWTFTAPRAFASVAQIALQRLDIVLVAALRGPVDAAVYTAASRFLVLGQFVTQALAAPVQPRLSAALAAPDGETPDTARAGRLYRMSAAWSVLLSWPLFLLVAVFAPFYLAVFGRQYTSHDAVVVVLVLAASMLAASATGLVDSVVLMAGRSSWNLATTAFALVINVALDIVLIPTYGPVGAAIGWCAAIVAANVAPLALAWRRLGLHPFDARVMVACAASAIAFGVAPSIGLLTANRSGAVVGAVLGGAAYVVFLVRRGAWFELDAMLRRRTVVR